jgi:hypothetical protein
MPLSINAELVERIITELQNLEIEYQNHKALILTEDDLKCQVFKKISAIIPDNLPTINPNISGSALHTEVKFFDEHGKLTLVPDLTIVYPRNISIYHSVEFRITRNGPKYGALPSKDFEIGGDAIIMELKFRRAKIGISEKAISSYQDDLNKIKRLQTIIRNRSDGHNKLFGIVAVFNKTNIGKSLFESFKANNLQLNDTKIFYGTGLVDFSHSTHYPF